MHNGFHEISLIKVIIMCTKVKVCKFVSLQNEERQKDLKLKKITASGSVLLLFCFVQEGWGEHMHND